MGESSAFRWFVSTDNDEFVEIRSIDNMEFSDTAKPCDIPVPHGEFTMDLDLDRAARRNLRILFGVYRPNRHRNTRAGIRSLRVYARHRRKRA